MASSKRAPFDTTFEGASAYLGDRVRRVLPGAATTLERRDDGSIAVRYHDTDVVTYRPNGVVEFDNGGFTTPTTKARINTYAPAGWYVRQHDYDWYLEIFDAHEGWGTIGAFNRRASIPVMGEPALRLS